jgi:hypothetical protein
LPNTNGGFLAILKTIASVIRHSSFVMLPHPRPTYDLPATPEAPFRRLRLTFVPEPQAC